jgi:hypothetical protein
VRAALSQEIKDAMRAEAERLAQPEDPLLVIRAVNNAFAAMDHELERFARVRIMAVRSLRRQGWSYDRIAEATGLSKVRVAQLARDIRR